MACVLGIVLNRVTDTELATHLLLNSERFQTWALLRRELCGCLACEGGSVGGLPGASWSQGLEHSTDGDRRATAAR